MSDDAAPPETGTTPPAAPAAGAGSTPPASSGGGQSIDAFPAEAQDYIRRLRQENASHRNEVKDERKRRESLETDGQQALTAAETRASTLEGKLLRFEVAAEKGLPLKFAARLQGSTKEEMEKDAEELKKEFGLDGTNGSTPGAASGFDGGVRRPVNKPKGMNDLIRQAAGRS